MGHLVPNEIEDQGLDAHLSIAVTMADGPYEAERAGPSGEEGGHQDRWEAHYRRFVVEKWGLRRRVHRLA